MTALASRVRGVPLPSVDQIDVGLGTLVGAALVALPALAGPVRLPEDATLAGVPLGPVVIAGGALLAVVGIADLLGRSELRQGGSILAFAIMVLGIAGVAVSLRDGLDGGGADLPESLPMAAASMVVAWGAGLAFGSLSFGPTRAAVLVGVSTIAVVLLLPVGPKGQPFLAVALDSAWSYDLVPLAAAALAALWRLLDLPRIGSIVLGGGLLVLATAWFAGAPNDAVACSPEAIDCLQPATFQIVLWAGCVWIGLGALLGRPVSD
jgi:hypothetical protein